MLNSSYQAIEEVLLNNEAAVCAAEAHGIVTGMICATSDFDRDRWLSIVFGDSWGYLNEGEISTLIGLCHGTRELLEADDFSFVLFLPDDDASLVERASALGEWCMGFLYGFGFGGSDVDWPGECTEFLSDLADISQLDAKASDESDELAYIEISEFVRLGVQIIWGDLQRHKPCNRRLH